MPGSIDTERADADAAHESGGSSIRLFHYVETVDDLLMRVPRPLQYVCVLLAIGACAAVGIHYVPRAYVDYSHTVLHQFTQPQTYGSDTTADVFEARVILDDPSAMYTKRNVEQTPTEAATWSKAASSPYPPAALLTIAAVYSLGTRTGIGFYGGILILACVFLAACATYCLQTRWYVFPLMCVNASYIAERFVYVQDDTYIVLLVVLMVALFLGRARRPLSHAVMAVAIIIKLSPLYYLKSVGSVGRWSAVLMIAIVIVGLGVPYLIWDNYAYIYHFQIDRKEHYWLDAASAALVVVAFTAVLAYVEARRNFDLEDRIGWSVVPFALYLALTMNAARHIFVVLLVPDKRGARTAAGALGFGVHYAVPRLVSAGAEVYAMAALLALLLAYHLSVIGWSTIRTDARRPLRTVGMMLMGTRNSDRRVGASLG